MRSSPAQAEGAAKGTRPAARREPFVHILSANVPVMKFAADRAPIGGSAFPWVIRRDVWPDSWADLLSAWVAAASAAVRNIMKDATVPEPIESLKKCRLYRGQMGNRLGGAIANPGAASAVDGSAGRVV
jgi:hypothetical protein